MSEGRCSSCGRTRKSVRFRGSMGTRMCSGCYQATLTFVCPRCRQERRVASASKDDAGRLACCWDCRQTNAAALHTATVTAAVGRIEATMPRELIIAAIESAAPSRDERRRLAEHLNAYPDALTSAASNAPRVMSRLITELRGQGAYHVVLPLCPQCQRPAILIRAVDEGRICAGCDRLARAEICSRCGNRRRVCTRIDGSDPICSSCNGARRAEQCGACGQRRRVDARTAEGGAICSGCYRQPPDRCDGCGRLAPIASRKSGQALCSGCYTYPQHRGGNCGRTRRISKRGRDGRPDLCHACNWAPIAFCSRCGEEAMCRHALGTGPPVCLRCLLAERLDAILTGPSGKIPKPLLLRATILAVSNPRTPLSWLDKKPPSIRVLADLAAGRLPLTHQALDKVPRCASVDHLRELLVACGALPQRNPHLARLEQAVDMLVAGVNDDHDRRLLRSFATWQVLRRLRRLAQHGTLTQAATKNARAQLAETARFLSYLHQQGRSLFDCQQVHVDDWLAQGGEVRYWIRDFLSWAARRGDVPKLEIACPARSGALKATDEDLRWSTARRLLHDETIDPADRVVGTLVLLYAQPLSRIARLRVDDIIDRDGDTHLALGRDHLFMPQPLGALLRRLPWRRQVGASGLVAPASRWLFPGRQAGHHIHPDYLRTRMAALGINCRAARTAALLQLAAKTPPTALADLLGLHPATESGSNAPAGTGPPTPRSEPARATRRSAEPGNDHLLHQPSPRGGPRHVPGAAPSRLPRDSCAHDPPNLVPVGG